MRKQHSAGFNVRVAMASLSGEKSSILFGNTVATEWPSFIETPARSLGILMVDCVEKGGAGRGIISHHDSWGAVDDGGEVSPSERVVLRVFTRTTCTGEAPPAVDRSVRRTRRAAAGIGAVLQ